MLNSLKHWAKQLKTDIYALYLASRDARLPWPVKLLAVCVVAYALSPIDLIPDFIPVLGYLDDLVLLPLGIWLVLHLIPDGVMADCRERAASGSDHRLQNWGVAAIIVAIWLGLGVAIGRSLILFYLSSLPSK